MTAPLNPARMLPMLVLLAGAAVAARGEAPPRAEAPARVGSEACANCHDEVVKAFARTVHGKADPAHACETCHGPGGPHAESGDPSLIQRFGAGVPAAQKAAACLTCHLKDRDRAGWPGSEHAVADVACTDCHNPHQPGHAESLLRSPGPGLCYDCHGQVKAQFALTERHPLADGARKGSLSCTDCHDPHARTERRLLGGQKQTACVKCHSEYRGPWVFEH